MSAADVEIVGEGIDGLRRAAKLARAGARVAYVEHGLRAGAPFLTESFLTPFRFNLGPSLVRRSMVEGLAVVEPDPILAVGPAMLDRAAVEVASGGQTVWDTIRAEPSDRRALLAGLAVLLGIDPERDGSGDRLRRAAAELDDLVLVGGGNGLVAAALIDEIMASGGAVYEGVGGSSARRLPVDDDIVGVSRIFLGLRAPVRCLSAFATAVGFEDDASLRARLGAVRSGADDRPLGFLLSNDHLDPRRPGDPICSVVWQGLLPSAPRRSRGVLLAETIAACGIDEQDVVFKLLWLPDETGDRLR